MHALQQYIFAFLDSLTNWSDIQRTASSLCHAETNQQCSLWLQLHENLWSLTFLHSLNRLKYNYGHFLGTHLLQFSAG